MAITDKIRLRVSAPTHIWFGVDFFECSTTELIKKLEAIPADHKAFINTMESVAAAMPKNQRRKIDPTWHLIDEYKFNIDTDFDGGTEVNLECWRWETDEELEARIKAEKARSASAKKAATTRKRLEAEKEKELYLKLKQKFEK